MYSNVRKLAAGFILVLLAQPATANDSAASRALGGIQLTREPRISMESERLTISIDKITVEYEFRNDSDKPITTEVAFPIPPYSEDMSAAGIRSFDDFRLWVDGHEVKYEVEAKAFFGKHDISTILEQYKIDIATLGHYEGSKQDFSPDLQQVPFIVRKSLIADGFFSGNKQPDGSDDGGIPRWEVQKTYHWTQMFPAHTVVHVRHEYTPGFGFEFIEPAIFGNAESTKLLKKDRKRGETYGEQEMRLLDESCIDPGLRGQVDAFVSGGGKIALRSVPGDAVQAEWVDYILTTANSWKMPIKKFELVVKKTADTEDLRHIANFCWDGSVTRLDEQHFSAKRTDFVPTRELKILYLNVSKSAPALTVAKKIEQTAERRIETADRRPKILALSFGTIGALLVGGWFLRRKVLRG